MRIAHPGGGRGGRRNLYCPMEPAQRLDAADAIVDDQLGRREPRRELHADDAAAARLRRRRGRRCCPAPQSAPLTRTSGWTAADDRVRRLLVEDDRRRRRSRAPAAPPRARCSGLIGRSGALVRAHRPIGVDGDDQRVAERPRVPQVADVPGMQQIEHAVGEHHRAAARAERGRRRPRPRRPTMTPRAACVLIGRPGRCGCRRRTSTGAAAGRCRSPSAATSTRNVYSSRW